MNTEQLTLPNITLPRSTVPPLKRIRALLVRMHAAFPECPQSLLILWHWTGELLGLHKKWAQDVAAIDDEMERVAPELWQCLQNDPPAKRARIWQAWQKTLAKTESTRAELETHC